MPIERVEKRGKAEMEQDVLGDCFTASRSNWGWFRMAVATAGLMCSVFSAVSSVGLLILFALRTEGLVPVSMGRLAAKAVVFVCVSLVLFAWILRRGRCAVSQPPPPPPNSSNGSWGLQWLVLPLLLSAVLMFPRLEEHPWMAPDEAHHFVVARNLAEYGLYASGHPDGGNLRVFDGYDSVGAPVIGPVAGCLRTFGGGLAAGRAAIGVFYLVLCVGMFLFLRAGFGAAAAATSLVFVTLGFGSIYLGRTLYGEVPAIAFIVFGLLFWRKAISGPSVVFWSVLCGICFGFAVLSKSIMAMAVFPLAGAFLYDLLTFRRIGWKQVVVPGFAGSVVILCWWTIQGMYRHDVAGAAEGTLSVYQHNLMFGVGSVGTALRWILREPVYAAGLLAGMLCIAPSVFLIRYEPASVALYLTAVFYGFWWVFFTPGQIPRYLWTSYAIAGAYAGILALDLLRRSLKKGTQSVKRGICVIILLGLIVPCGMRMAKEGNSVYFTDEMRDDRSAAEYVRELPEQTRIISVYWPLQNTLNFLTGRFIEPADVIPEPLPPGTAVFADTRTQSDLIGGRAPSHRIGPYVIFYRKE